MKRTPWVCAGAFAALGLFAFTGPAQAQLPAPAAFISQLDLLCYNTNLNPQPPNLALQLRHLNPLLANVPEHTGTLGALRELCMPIYKDNIFPPTDIRRWVEWVDLACYDWTAPSLNRELDLHHLNPVVIQKLSPAGGAPAPERVDVLEPTRLCVPVQKLPPVGVQPIPIPADVLQLVSHIDLECYNIQPPQPFALPLQLRHLNQELNRQFPDGAPGTTIQGVNPKELCVPVAKQGDSIPSAILPILQEIDIKRYEIQPAGQALSVNLRLQHLNPVFVQAGAPIIGPITLLFDPLLGLPVRKEPVDVAVPLMPLPAMFALAALVLASGLVIVRRRR